MRTKKVLLWRLYEATTWPKISHHKVTISNDGFEIEFARSFFPDPLVILVQILDGYSRRGTLKVQFPDRSQEIPRQRRGGAI